MKKSLMLFVVVASLTLVAGSVFAHHGRGATYDGDKEQTVSGVLTELAWRNPHVAIYVDVKDASGKVTNWAFESSNTSTMSREGWTRTIFKPGQPMSVTFNPSRSGAPIGILRSVKLADGKVINSRGNANTID
jgi:hypothetical protein